MKGDNKGASLRPDQQSLSCDKAGELSFAGLVDAGKTVYGALDIEGTRVPLVVTHGQRKGPTLLLVGLQHAGEVAGPAAIDRVLDTLDPATLRGTLVCLPVANPADARTVPPPHSKGADWNLNRQWPGDAASPNRLSRLAAALWTRVVTAADALVDLHCCRIVDPRFAAALEGHAASERLASSLGLDAVDLQTPRSYATGLLFMEFPDRLGKPAALLESQPAFFQPREAVDACASAVWRAMLHLDMIDGPPGAPLHQPRFGAVFSRSRQGTALKATTGGYLAVRRWPGEPVRAGEAVAVIRSLDTFEPVEPLLSPLDGAVTFAGDAGGTGLVCPGDEAAGVKPTLPPTRPVSAPP